MTTTVSRQPAQRVARPARNRVRDSIYLTIIIVIGGFAVLGIVSASVLLSGNSLGNREGGSPRSALGSAQATATAVVRLAEHRAEATRASILRDARQRAKAIIARARHRSRGLGGHPVATATAIPIPTSTPGIPGAPDLSGVPASWEIVVFNFNPPAGALSIVNRTANVLSGTVLITFLKQHGAIAGVRRAAFSAVPGRSVASLLTRPAPRYFSTYRIRVVGVT